MSEEWCTHGPSLNCKDCEIERLRVVVDAAQQLVEQGLAKRTTRDQWNAWHILKDALEDDDE